MRFELPAERELVHELIVLAALERTDAPGVVCAEGGARVVWADYPAKKSVPLPDWLRAEFV